MASAKRKPFSSEEDERLIEEVRKYPNLYNSSLAEYRDHERNEQSWLAIGRLFTTSGRPWRDFKDRWKYLRDQYTKAKRSNEGRSGDPGGKKYKWKYYDLMTFLSDHVKHRDTDGNTPRSVALKSDTQVEDEEQSESEDDASVEEEPPLATESLCPSRPDETFPLQTSTSSGLATQGSSRSSTPSLPTTKKKKPVSKTTNVDEAFAKYLKSRTEAKDTDNSEYLFGKMVAASLFKLSRRNRALAKLKIQEVLYEMEERELTSSNGNASQNQSVGQNYEVQQQKRTSLQHSMCSSFTPATSAAQSPPYNLAGPSAQTY